MLGNFRLLYIFALIRLCFPQVIEKSWWQTASFYQIYPRSLQDTNGDGIGDLRGVTQRLAYLKEIGITATWLSPIMTSPMADFGYDVSDFYGIDPLFGNMADFEEMVAEANKTGIKIIMDFVPNHSSDECEWFIKSAARDPEYDDWYIWHPGKMVDGVRQPPSNWKSVFRGSAWQWHEQRQEYYLHQFLPQQPDLNFRNPRVIEEMKNVIRFWVRKGVMGFRIDSVPHIFEIDVDSDGNYPDEPRSYNTENPDDYGYVNQIYTKNQPETTYLIYDFRDVLDELKAELNTEDIVLMLESYEDLKYVMQYFGNGTREGGQIPFNFALINSLSDNSNAHDYENIINYWFNALPENRTSNWVVGNHDKSRIGSRLGQERIDSINILTATLPGCVVTYYGEEIGMLDVPISWEEGVDPSGCNGSPDNFNSRDPERTPMQWNENTNADFSTVSPWLRVASDCNRINVKVQRGIARSHLNIYKQLKTLRGHPTLMHGATEVKAVNDNVLLIMRHLDGLPTFITLMNINGYLETVNLLQMYPDLDSKLEYSLVTDRSLRRTGDLVLSKSVHLMPHESAVLRTPIENINN